MATTGTTDLIGRVLAGRYRLLDPIGTGATGRVLLADDVRLRRRVAVKVLHDGLAQDGGFLRRFRAEAQTAAALHHPHVMAVYDWGEDEGVPFMVVELLKGGSLRGLLDTGVRPSVAQVTHIGRQVAAALQYADARGIVHRDIKPAGLLFDEHGVVRVADFGLARALAEASWTEPTGTVLGTVRYAAPEQGSAALDGRADLYSLAVVLTEAAVGEVPVVAETALGTLAARSAQGIEPPETLGPLAPVLRKAGRPQPADRFPDAQTMGAALASVARRLPPPEPLRLPGLGDGVEDADPTRLGRMHDPDEVAAPDDPTLGLDARPLAISTVSEPHRLRTSLVPIAVALSIVAVLVATAAVVFGIGGGSGAPVAVPSLVGLVTSSAADQATSAGLLMRVVERKTADDPSGLIIEQHPAPGDHLGKGASIEVVVSRGPPPVAVPVVAGQAIADATSTLQRAGFVVTVVRQNDETVAKDIALGTTPAAAVKARPDTTIKLLVSDGPAPVVVPDVAGKTYDAAAQLLTAAKLQPVRRDVFSSTVASGATVGSDPAGGTKAPRDSQVAVLVSRGPEMVTVPNTIGMTIDAASQALAAVGLNPDVQNYQAGRHVSAQVPGAGASVKKGSSVTLFFL